MGLPLSGRMAQSNVQLTLYRLVYAGTIKFHYLDLDFPTLPGSATIIFAFLDFPACARLKYWSISSLEYNELDH